jgi:hypothetical protein
MCNEAVMVCCKCLQGIKHCFQTSVPQNIVGGSAKYRAENLYKLSNIVTISKYQAKDGEIFNRQLALLEQSPCSINSPFVFWSVNVFLGSGSSTEGRVENNGIHY